MSEDLQGPGSTSGQPRLPVREQGHVPGSCLAAGVTAAWPPPQLLGHSQATVISQSFPHSQPAPLSPRGRAGPVRTPLAHPPALRKAVLWAVLWPREAGAALC